MSIGTSENELRRLAVDIVASHISHNVVATENLPGMIRSVYAALNAAGCPSAMSDARPEPAVPIKKSVFPDYLVCLEDGKKMTLLKRHLQATYNMTPDQYRARWGLPSTYPMVSPRYAARRSSLAKEFGLGRIAAVPKPVSLLAFQPIFLPGQTSVASEVVVQRIPARKRGRKLGSKNRVHDRVDLAGG